MFIWARVHWAVKVLAALALICPRMVAQKATTARPIGAGAMQTGILVIRGDSDGTLAIDGVDSGLLRAGEFLRVTTVAGDHFVEVRDVGSGCKWEKEITVPPGMQVAERVDFGAGCTSRSAPAFGRQPAKTPADKPELGGLASGSPTAAVLLIRGCLLFELMRSRDAVTVLEQATALVGQDVPCLENARTSVQRARTAISDCEQPNVKRQNCDVLMPIAKLMAGESAEVFASLNSYIQAHEPDQFPSHNAATLYQLRALSEYAIGNTNAALLDLQKTLDWSQREPGAAEYDTHFYRAAVLMDIGNESAAKNECGLALTFREFAGFKRDVFCARLIDGSLPQLSAVPVPAPQVSIAEEVDAVVKSGRYVALPVPIAQLGIVAPTGRAVLNVQNDTAYTLTVLFSGPGEQRVDVAPRSSSSINLISGTYRVVGRVNDTNVLPSYGQYEFAGAEGIHFYVQ